MKKLMLGTTALVAASVLSAGAASAAEKIKLNVGGYMMNAIAFADYSNEDSTDDRASHKFTSEGEVHFVGSTTLDNGIQFGVNIQLEARDTTDDQVDETYIWASGSFGRINMGSEDGAASLMHVHAPAPVPAWNLHDRSAGINGYGFSTKAATGDYDKITYFTPRISGFQFGASYAPDVNCEVGGNDNCESTDPINTDTDDSENWQISANYKNKFDGVDVAASIGYASTSEQDNSDNDDELSVGASVGFSGVTIGAAYKDTSGLGATDDDATDWNAGVTYGQGPWKVGVQYAFNQQDDGVSELEAYGVVVGGQYNLGPGVTVFGAAQFFNADDGYASNSDYDDDVTVYIIGTQLSF